ncbi:MAG: hypothetical protein J6B85_08695 [Lachnospiraceae bacterium]|nr:hypothetical protein [Lachnospiraceae bacterium]
MWLLTGNKVPDHCTIARFRTQFLKEVCEDLVGQLARILLESGEASGNNLSVVMGVFYGMQEERKRRA